MRTNWLTAVAVGTLLLGLAVAAPAQAGVSVNGLTWNGLGINGLTVAAPAPIALGALEVRRRDAADEGRVTSRARGGFALLGRLAALPLALTLAADAAAQETPLKVEVVGTTFRLTMADGRVLTGDALVGAVLALGDEVGTGLKVRIDAVRPDPRDPMGEVTLYGLSVEEPASGAWRDLCAPDAAGLAMGFPLAGTWTAAGEHLPSDRAFSLACTSGVIGKCVRMGYRPWAAAADGTSLWAYHQACTRLLRADYCGDGTPHTRDGTPVNIADRLGLQTFDTTPAMSFEAAWGADGAVCVHRVRIPEVVSLDELRRACPGRLQGKLEGDCRMDAALDAPETLLWNQSLPTPP